MQTRKLGTPALNRESLTQRLKIAAFEALCYPIIFWTGAFSVAFFAFELGFLKDGSPGMKLISDVMTEGFNISVLSLNIGIWMGVFALISFIDITEDKGLPDLVRHARHRISDSFATIGLLSIAVLAFLTVVDASKVKRGFVVSALITIIASLCFAVFFRLKPPSQPFDLEKITKADFQKMLSEIRFGQGLLISDALLETAYPRNVASNGDAALEVAENAGISHSKSLDGVSTFLFRKKPAPTPVEKGFLPELLPFPNLSQPVPPVGSI